MDLPIPASQAELPTSSSSKGGPSAQPKTSQLTEKKIPKWLKLGQSEFTNLPGRTVCDTDRTHKKNDSFPASTYTLFELSYGHVVPN